MPQGLGRSIRPLVVSMTSDTQGLRTKICPLVQQRHRDGWLDISFRVRRIELPA